MTSKSTESGGAKSDETWTKQIKTNACSLQSSDAGSIKGGEKSKQKNNVKSRRHGRSAKRCPIYIPRSEHNLLTNKGIQLVELLGEGSYSKVYLCRKYEQMADPSKAPVIAMKIVDTSKTSTDYINKFLPRELSVLLKIRHPHIIKLYLLFQRKNKFYICMRYAERGDLLEYVLAHGLITENRARYWTSQLAKAIEYLHTMNIVHRDIKTENVLITECFNVKLCDFGFSRFIGQEEMSSTFCGSISYSPPEVLQTKSYDAKKSDMWSLGVVVFVMLVKRLPFIETENPKLLLAEQLQKSYIVPPKMDQILSPYSKKVIKHLLEPIPKKRWAIEELITSQWLAMDFRLIFKTPSEREALGEAIEIAANRAGRIWTEMVEQQKQVIGTALQNRSQNVPDTTDLFFSLDRKKCKISSQFRDVTFEKVLSYLNVNKVSGDFLPSSKKTTRKKLTEREEFFRRRQMMDEQLWITQELKEWDKKQRRRTRDSEGRHSRFSGRESILTNEEYEELNQMKQAQTARESLLARQRRRTWFSWRKESSSEESDDQQRPQMQQFEKQEQRDDRRQQQLLHQQQLLGQQQQRPVSDDDRPSIRPKKLSMRQRLSLWWRKWIARDSLSESVYALPVNNTERK